MIGVARDGSIALVFNSEGMYLGAADSGGRFEIVAMPEGGCRLTWSAPLA